MIDINHYLSAKITQARGPKSYKGATIVVGVADKVVRELSMWHFSGDQIRAAIDRAAKDGKLAEPEVRLFKERIDNLLGESLVPKKIPSDVRYAACLNEVAAALTKKDKPGPGFATPDYHKFNPRFWKKMPSPEEKNLPKVIRTSKVHGTFEPITKLTSPSAAVRDILHNPGLYEYDCATGAIAAAYLTLVKLFDPADFDEKFEALCIGPWAFDPYLQSILDHQGPYGMSQKGSEANLKPGDIVYFNNPGAIYDTRESRAFSGENATYLGDGKYYAHPLGIKTADEILTELLKWCGVDDPTLPDNMRVLKPYLIAEYFRPNTGKILADSSSLPFDLLSKELGKLANKYVWSPRPSER
jgi:hypothetical protein